MVLTQNFSAHVRRQIPEDPASADTPIPTGPCSTGNSNHIVSAALPWSTESCSDSSAGLVTASVNLPGNKEVTNKDIYIHIYGVLGFVFFLSYPTHLHVEAWKHLVPASLNAQHILFCLGLPSLPLAPEVLLKQQPVSLSTFS